MSNQKISNILNRLCQNIEKINKKFSPTIISQIQCDNVSDTLLTHSLEQFEALIIQMAKSINENENTNINKKRFRSLTESEDQAVMEGIKWDTLIKKHINQEILSMDKRVLDIVFFLYR